MSLNFKITINSQDLNLLDFKSLNLELVKMETLQAAA